MRSALVLVFLARFCSNDVAVDAGANDADSGTLDVVAVDVGSAADAGRTMDTGVDVGPGVDAGPVTGVTCVVTSVDCEAVEETYTDVPFQFADDPSETLVCGSKWLKGVAAVFEPANRV